MIGRILFLIFFLVALLEVGVFILVGDLIGLGPTLLLILITAVLGAVLLKRQGLATYRTAMEKLDKGEPPLGELLDGIALFVAGALLLTPGFVTDAIGFALFVPGVRRRLGARFAVAAASAGGQTRGGTRFYYHETRTRRPGGPSRGPSAGPEVIEGEAVVIEEHDADAPSGPGRDDGR